MNKDLYYCQQWKHQFYKDYDICVSDFVENRVGGALLQIHCVVIHNNEVVRGFREKDLFRFEENIRAHIRAFIDKMGMVYPERADEELTVKMWYYNPDGSNLNTSDIPLRIAITFYRPKKIEDKEQTLLKEQIFTELCDLCKK